MEFLLKLVDKKYECVLSAVLKPWKSSEKLSAEAKKALQNQAWCGLRAMKEKLFPKSLSELFEYLTN